MFETYTTVIGNVVSDPRRRQTAGGEEVISFRVACNSRRMDRRTQEWIDGPALYLTVSCWRRLLTGVGAAIAKGRPIIAHGQIKTNEYVTADGEKRADLEMTALAVGLDLSRCVAIYQEPRMQVVEMLPAVETADEASPDVSGEAQRPAA